MHSSAERSGPTRFDNIKQRTAGHELTMKRQIRKVPRIGAVNQLVERTVQFRRRFSLPFKEAIGYP